MKTVQQGNTTLAYRTVGEGPKYLMAVHGWMVDGSVFDELLAAFDSGEWTIIVPDLRGAGNSSEGGDYHLMSYVNDLIAVADAAGADTFSLVGHSMGGQIAQLLASECRKRVDALVLLCPVPLSGMELPAEADELFASSGQDRDKQAAILDMACLDLNDEAKARLLAAAAKISASCIHDSYRSWTAGGFEDRLPRIDAPTLVVGSDDPFLPPEFLNAAVVEPNRNASFIQIGGAGHYVQVERPKETAQILEKFLAAQ